MAKPLKWESTCLRSWFLSWMKRLRMQLLKISFLCFSKSYQKSPKARNWKISWKLTCTIEKHWLFFSASYWTLRMSPCSARWCSWYRHCSSSLPKFMPNKVRILSLRVWPYLIFSMLTNRFSIKNLSRFLPNCKQCLMEERKGYSVPSKCICST